MKKLHLLKCFIQGIVYIFFSLLLKYLFHSNDKEINQRFKEKLGKIPMSKAFPTRMIHIPWLEWPLYCNPLLKSPEYSKM